MATESTTSAPSSPAADADAAGPLLLAGRRVALVGRMAGMKWRDAQQQIRHLGGLPLESLEAGADLIVIGEEQWPPANDADPLLAQLRTAIQQGAEAMSEAQLWQRLGLVEDENFVQRLYTPSMLAELLGVSVAVIRRWHRRGLIVPSRLVHRLPYFDFQEVATARRLAQWLAAGMSAQTIERNLDALRRWLPEVDRPLAQLSVIVEGKRLLLRQGDGLIESGGQLRLDFDAADDAPSESLATTLSLRAGLSTLSAETRVEDSGAGEATASDTTPAAPSVSELLAEAGALEDAGELAEAAEMYRAALAAGGPQAEVCFQLAELLYRLGELTAARERYYMAIELDEEYVEARANLGCVLAETGQPELAIAAFHGALAFHADYLDAHYHLARTLDDIGRAAEAEPHWRNFLSHSPDSPWTQSARERLGLENSQ